jgi:hypothetical protein
MSIFVLWDVGLILTYAGVVNTRALATLPGFAPFKARKPEGSSGFFRSAGCMKRDGFFLEIRGIILL